MKNKKLTINDFYTESGRRKIYALYDPSRLHIYHIHNSPECYKSINFFIDLFDVNFPDITQVVINGNGVIFFYSCLTKLNYCYNFFTKEYLGVL